MTVQCLNADGCRTEQISPYHVEMIGLINGCIETMTWIRTTAGIEKGVDYKSDSIVMIGGDDNQSTATANETLKEMDATELSGVKRNVESLREVICEFIAVIQDWLKVLNDAIESKTNTYEEDADQDTQNID